MTGPKVSALISERIVYILIHDLGTVKSVAAVWRLESQVTMKTDHYRRSCSDGSGLVLVEITLKQRMKRFQVEVMFCKVNPDNMNRC